MEIIYKGYRAVSYGKSSVAIYNSEGRNVFHTGSRAFPDTENELKKCIDFYIMLAESHRKDEN